LVVDRGVWTDRHRSAEAVYRSRPLVPERIELNREGSWRRRWLELEHAARVALDQALDAEPGMTEMRVARDVARAAVRCVRVVGSSMPIRALDATMEAGSPPIISNRGASGIDGFVSTVLGVAHATGGAVGLAGDLSMLHDHNGFLTDRRPDAVFVVVDNDGGGIFSMLPQGQHAGEHFERVLGTPHGRDFRQYAAFHQLGYHRVDDPAQLTETVQGLADTEGLDLVHVRTDRDQGVEVRGRIGSAVRQALSAGG
jgi:2-succinyl-5-enolpyruvyl-6-hydroxy-3-cyclohexene-1-carboxylate synthase